MWNGLFMLLALSVVMAVVSFLAGLLPLSFSLSPRSLRLITALGTGVLVGTSLIVIIPEGIETLYSAGRGHEIEHSELLGKLSLAPRYVPAQAHSVAEGTLTRRLDILTGFETSEELNGHQGDSNVSPGSKEHEPHRTGPDDGRDFDTGDEGNDPMSSLEPPDGSHPGYRIIGGSDERVGGLPESPAGKQGDTAHSSEARDPHAWVGISLILGFILMYLIDTLPHHASPSQRPQRLNISLNSFTLNRTPTDPEPTSEGLGAQYPTSRATSTTLGLVIHASADGIALGASSTTTSSLSFIIFLAIMIHKAPAAFGLTSVLLKQGLSKRSARMHLIIFSLAAPAGALCTWAAAHVLGGFGNESSTEFATGVLLLFSGGTFLYVAMHTMQESGDGHDHGGQNGGMNGYAEVPVYDQQGPAKRQGPGLGDTLVCVAGMLFPMLTQVGHVH